VKLKNKSLMFSSYYRKNLWLSFQVRENQFMLSL
jgi:hypothetical protein